jgi:hypothetical protein
MMWVNKKQVNGANSSEDRRVSCLGNVGNRGTSLIMSQGEGLRKSYFKSAVTCGATGQVMKTGKLSWMVFFFTLLVVSSCGGGAPGNSGTPLNYTVGGTVSNLLVDGLVLQNNGCDDLAIEANSTSFTFPTPVADGEGYNVTVRTQPVKTQICTVTQATGTVSGAIVRDIDIQCSDQPLIIK